MEFLPPPVMRASGAEYSRRSFHIVAPVGITVADLMRPAFWAHHGNKVSPGDVIDVIADDGSFDAQLRVVTVSPTKTDVTMRMLRLWQPEASNLVLADDAPLEVNHTPKTGWRVIRKADRVELVRGIPQKADAIKWALDTLRVAA